MTDVRVGGVAVEVKATLDPLDQGLEKARAKANAFDKDASKNMDHVAQRANAMGEAVAKAAAKAGQAQAGITKAVNDVAAAHAKTAEAARRSAEVQAESARRAAAAFQAQARAQEAQRRINERLGVRPNSNQGSASGSARRMEDLFAERDAAQARANARDVGGAVEGVVDQIGGIPPVAGRAAGALANLVGVGFTAVIAAAGAAALVIDKTNNEIERLGKIAQGAGRSAGLTAGQLNEMAKASAEAGKTTVGEARALQESLLKTGQIGGEVFEGLGAAQRKYAQASGVDLKAAQSELATMFADPIKGADLLNERFGSLSASTRNQIRLAVEHGDKARAQALLLRELNRAVGELDTGVVGLAGAWDALARGASTASASMVDAINKASILVTLGPQALQAMRAAADEQERQAEQARARAELNRASNAGTDLARTLDPDGQRREELARQRATLRRGMGAAVLTGDTKAVLAQAEAFNKVDRAQRTYLSTTEKATRLANLEAQANQVRAQKETAATRAKLGEIAAEKARVEASGEVVSSAEVEARARNAATIASSRQAKASAAGGQSLIREAASMEAAARGALALANAYLESDSAAMKAEASRQGATRAARSGAEAEAQIRRQLAINIAEQAANGGKLVAQLRAQAGAQEAANAAVAAGKASTETATRDMQFELQLAPLLVAQTQARGAALETLTRIIEALRAAQLRLNAAQDAGRLAQDNEASKDRVATIRREIELLGASARVRERELADLEAIQRLKSMGIDKDSPEGKTYRGQATAEADANSDKETAQFIDGVTRATEAQVRALRAQAREIGMTHREAAVFRREQELLADAMARGEELTDALTQKIHAQAEAYGTASDAARQLEERQRAAADAATFLSDSISDGLIDVLTGSKKAGDAVRDVAKSLLRAQLDGALKGTGPFAGIMGTNKTAGPGQPNGGLISGLIGKLFGVGQGEGGSPVGTAADPIYVAMAGAGGAGGMLQNLFGANDNASAGNVFDMGGNPISEGVQELMSAQDSYLSRFSDVFRQNSEGGFVGALKNLFSGGGGMGGQGGGGILGMIKGLFGGGAGGAGGAGAGAGGGMSGGLGAIFGSILANVAHTGWDVGRGGQPMRQLPASIFLSAPRLHQGLEPDEFPAVLQRGERVQSRREVARGGGRGPIHITVNTPDADSFRRSERQVANGLNRRLRSAG